MILNPNIDGKILISFVSFENSNQPPSQIILPLLLYSQLKGRFDPPEEEL